MSSLEQAVERLCRRCETLFATTPSSSAAFCPPCRPLQRAERERERRREQAARRRAHGGIINPGASPQGVFPIEQPVEVLKRVAKNVGPDSAAALAESMNTWRRLNGVPEVRL